MSKTIGYLRGVHVVIATPHCLAEISQFSEFKELFADLKALAVDEVDACFAVSSCCSSRLESFVVIEYDI